MQIGRTRLSEEEKTRRRARGLCLYWTISSYLYIKRPGSPLRGRLVVSQYSLLNAPSHPLPSVTLSAGSSSVQQAVLADSGADASLMEAQLVERLGLSRIPLPSAVEATALDGRRLWRVTH